MACRQGGCPVGLVPLPGDPIHARGPVRLAALQRPFPHRPIPVMGERGARHVGRRLCLRGEPVQAPRDGHRARRPLALSCLGAAMTPGCACAAPGPPDGLGSLAARPRCLPRARLSRLALPGGVLVCVGCGRRCGPRSDAPLRLPNAPPECLRVPACPSLPVVPALWWMARPGGAAGLSAGSVGRAVDSPQSAWLCLPPRSCRQAAEEALTRARVLPLPACSGLRPRWPLPGLAESGRADTVCQRRAIIHGAHTLASGLLGWLALAGPQRSHTLRGPIPTLLTCATRFLTCVSSRQRVLLLGWWRACALGRLTAWSKHHRHLPERECFQRLHARLRGHYNDYGVRGNSRSLPPLFSLGHGLYVQVAQSAGRQAEQLHLGAVSPGPRPHQNSTARYHGGQTSKSVCLKALLGTADSSTTEEPDAGKLHVRVCTGGAG